MGKAVPFQAFARSLSEGLRAELFEKFDARRPADDDDVRHVLALVPRQSSAELEATVYALQSLGNDVGLSAFAEAGALLGFPDFASSIPNDLAATDKALWVWLRHPDVFRKAELLHEVDELPLWRERNDLPRSPIDHSEDAVHALERDIAEIFMAGEGCGRWCTVEVVSRGNVYHVVAYPDDHAENITVHNCRRHLERQTIRKTFMVVFVFDSEAGTLALNSRGGVKRKERLEQVFAHRLLGVPALPAWDPKDRVDLNVLKSIRGPLATDAADGVTVLIKQVVVARKNDGDAITLKPKAPKPEQDVAGRLEADLNALRWAPEQVNVLSIRLRFKFAPSERALPRSATVSVTGNGFSTVRNLPEEVVQLVNKYLERWGIIRRRPTDSAARTA